MTLKEKFDLISCKDCDMPYCDRKCTMLSDRELNLLELVADEFAIGFAEWVLDRFTFKDFIHKEPKELLEIYKKEKDL